MEPPEALIGRLPDCLTLELSTARSASSVTVSACITSSRFYDAGFSAEMLLCQFPTLELAGDPQGDRVLPGESRSG